MVKVLDQAGLALYSLIVCSIRPLFGVSCFQVACFQHHDVLWRFLQHYTAGEATKVITAGSQRDGALVLCGDDVEAAAAFAPARLRQRRREAA